jgi:hypothetical protein
VQKWWVARLKVDVYYRWQNFGTRMCPGSVFIMNLIADALYFLRIAALFVLFAALVVATVSSRRRAHAPVLLLQLPDAMLPLPDAMLLLLLPDDLVGEALAMAARLAEPAYTLESMVASVDSRRSVAAPMRRTRRRTRLERDYPYGIRYNPIWEKMAAP